jgi:LemA protein
MIIALGAMAAVVVGVVLALVVSANRFARQRQLLHSSWAQVDAELRRRYDLVPNLVQVVRGYAAHERTTLEAVATARGVAQGAVSEAGPQSAAQGALGGAMRRVVGIAERYPDLAASDRFRVLHASLVTTEDRIQATRRLFNANVRDYNIRVNTFPSNVVARLFHHELEQYFTLEPAIRRSDAPAVQLTSPA